MIDQVKRIEQNTSGEVSPPVALQLHFASTTPDEVLDRTRQVMRLIAVSQREEWPGEEDWRRKLPAWFVSTFEGHSLDELMANPNLWDFGSWLGAMKHPGWEWWSSEVGINEGIVRCVAHTDPFAIEPLIYLLHSAGASKVEFAEE